MSKILCSAIASALVFSATAQAAPVAIDISGVKATQGKVLVAVYTKNDTWLRKASFYSMAVVGARTATARFDDLPEGDYAISFFVDENDNGKLDTNAIGIPIEPYGFSNDAAGTFGPPTFEQAKFKVGKDPLTLAAKAQ